MHSGRPEFLRPSLRQQPDPILQGWSSLKTFRTSKAATINPPHTNPPAKSDQSTSSRLIPPAKSQTHKTPGGALCAEARNGRPDSAARRLLKTHNRNRSTPVFSSRKPKSTNLGGVLCPKTATASLIILSWTKAFSAKPSSSKKSVIGYRWHSSGSASADRS